MKNRRTISTKNCNAFTASRSKGSVGLYASHLPHSLNFFNRAKTYAWFSRWLKNPAARSKETAFDIFPEEHLNATPTGQVLTSIGGRSVVQLNTDRARILMQQSPFRTGSLNENVLRPGAHEKLTELLALPNQREALNSRIRSVNPREDIVIEEFQFESDPGMRIPGWFVAPASGTGSRSTILYLTEDGGDDVVAEPGSMNRLLAAGHSICAISLRGLGITQPRFPSGGPLYYEASVHLGERFAWTCLVMGRPVIGQRVWDTMRAIDYLVSRPDVDKSQIRIAGVGGAGLAAIMTAFLDHRPRSVLVDRALVSYVSILESKNYSLKLDWFVPGILRSFDLPEIAIGISPRPCWILNGVDANGNVVQESSLHEQYRHNFGHEAALPSTLRLLVNPEHDPQNSYLEWLKNT